MSSQITETVHDSNFANRYAFQRSAIAKHNTFLKMYPALFSRAIVEIHADRELMAHNPDFHDKCIYVRLRSSADFCQAMRCNKFYPRGKSCIEQTPLQIFYTGHNTDTACEYACFNIFVSGITGRPLKDQSAAFNTEWSIRCATCLMYNPMLYAQMIDDYHRTTVHTTRHRDTVGTGYDRPSEPYHERFYIDEATGEETFRFRLNDWTCQDFDMQLYFDDNHRAYCSPSKLEKFDGFILGDTLYNYLRHGMTSVVQYFDEDFGRPVFPPIDPAIIESFKAFEYSKRQPTERGIYIDEQVTLSTLGITPDLYGKMYFTTEHDNVGGGLTEYLLVYRSVSSSKLPPIPEYLQYVSDRDDLRYGRRHIDEFEMLGQGPLVTRRIYNDANAESTHTAEEHMIRDLTIAAGNVLGFVVAQSLVKHVLVTQIPKILTEETLRLSSEYALRLITQNLIAHELAVHMAVEIGEVAVRSALVVGKVIIPGLDVALIVFLAIDLALAFTDPLKVNEVRYYGTQDAVDIYSKIQLTLDRHETGRGIREFSPAMFMTTHDLLQSQNLASYRRAQSKDATDAEIAEAMSEVHKAINGVPPGVGFDSFIHTQNLPWSRKNGHAGVNRGGQLVSLDTLDYLSHLKFNHNGQRITVFDRAEVPLSEHKIQQHRETVHRAFDSMLLTQQQELNIESKSADKLGLYLTIALGAVIFSGEIGILGGGGKRTIFAIFYFILLTAICYIHFTNARRQSSDSLIKQILDNLDR